MTPIAISPASYYHCDVILIMTSRAYGARGARSPRSHYDVIFIVTPFATELATPTVTDVRTYVTYGHLTVFRLIYTDFLTCVLS